MKSTVTTVADYLEELPADRREVISAVRKVILKNLPKGYAECMGYGMIGYVVPHSLYPKGYHCDPKLPLPYANLGSQKGHMVLHAMSLYIDPAMDLWFKKAWQATGKKLDMGKGCVRFKRLEDVSLEVIGELIARVSVKDYIARMEKALADRPKSPKSSGKPTKPRKS